MNKTSDQQEFNFLTSIIFIISAIGSIIKSLTTLLSNIKHIPDSIVIWVPFIGTLINAYAVLYLILSKRRILGAYIFVGMGLLSIILSFIVPDVDPVSMIIANSIQIVSFSLILLLPKNKKTGWRLLIENSGIKSFVAAKSTDRNKHLSKSTHNPIHREVDNQSTVETAKKSKPTNTDSKIRINKNNNYVEIAVVKDFSANSHHTEYAVFDLKYPEKNVKLMGVEDGDVFALSFATNCTETYAVAVYLDGVNISQRYGIHSLNSIPEFKRDQYNEHKGIFYMHPSGEEMVIYLDRYSQVSGKNRLFTFTTKEGGGINEVLIEDKSLRNRIDVYVWIDETVLTDDDYPRVLFSIEEPNDIRFRTSDKGIHDVKIGAGEETNKHYSTTDMRLSNPEFLGKATFIYMHRSNLEHLGRTLIPVGYSEFEYDDPMDLIPES